MNHQKVWFILLPLVLIGVVLIITPYLTTLIDENRTAQMRPAVKLADIRTGTFVEVELPASRVFVLRDFDDKVHVFSVPYSDNAYWLPEFDWSHPGIPCAEFGPDNKNGLLLEGGAFRCRRPDQGEFLRYEHSWAYSGRNLGYRTADMKIADYQLTDDSILLSQWR